MSDKIKNSINTLAMFNNSHEHVIIIEEAGTIRHTGSADLN